MVSFFLFIYDRWIVGLLSRREPWLKTSSQQIKIMGSRVFFETFGSFRFPLYKTPKLTDLDRVLRWDYELAH